VYYLKKDNKEIIQDIVIQNIQDCGCVAIKLTQWAIPLIECNLELSFSFPLHKLESFYENCNYHTISYTKKIYQREINESLDSRYEMNGLIASASMGQVYKVTDKRTKVVYALKVLHPDLGYNITLLKYMIRLLYLLPGVLKLIQSCIPIHLDEFFRDFESQTNLVNEANNCLQFGRFYNDNPFIIIPEVIQVSENTLLMSYEEGCRFDELDESEYTRFKCITLLKLFIKNNELIMNFIHGDIHKGNWKVRMISGIPQLLIYDFGLCWRVPDTIISHLSQLDTLFLEIDGKSILNEDKLENMINGFHALLMEKCTKDEIRDIVTKDIVTKDIVTKDTLSSDVMGILSQLLKLSRKTGYLIDSFILQSMIIASQLQKYFEDYHFARNEEGDNDLTYEYYRRRLPDIYCFCKTHNIFEEYQKHLEKEFSLSGIKVEGMFETIDQENNFNDFPDLKNMAIS